MIQTFRRRIFPSALSVLLAWLIGFTPLVREIDRLVVDAFMTRIGDTSAPAVLLVRIAPQRLDEPGHLLAVVDAALDAGASTVGVTRLPASKDGKLLEALAERGVLVGRTLSGGRPEPWPATTSTPDWGVLALPEAKHGVRRFLPIEVTVGGRRFPAFAARLARHHGAMVPDQDRFGVNFALDGPLPSISADQALDGNLIPEMVRGRVLLIGPGVPPGAAGLATPVDPSLSAAHLQAYGVDTLVRERRIHEPGPFWRLLLVLAVALGSVVPLERLGLRGIWFTLGAILAICLAPGLFLSVAQTRTPITELVFTLMLTSALTTRARILAEERDLRDLLSESSHRLRQRVPTQSFLDSEEHWRQILTLVDQTLELRRTLFLERDPQAHRVREIIAEGCSLTDVAEQRRDYDREPYVSSIAARAPLRLRDPYLLPLDNDLQYLVPLSHAGMVQGFWALSVEDRLGADRSGFEDALQSFAEQIAEMLYLRRQFEQVERAKRTRREAGTTTQGLATGSARIHLARTIDAIERRLQIFEDVFASQATATIVYDLFGQVVQSNQAMETLLREGDFDTQAKSALDLLQTLTREDRSYCQSLLRSVILRHQALHLHLTVGQADHHTEREYQLTIGPVVAHPVEGDPVAVDVRPFALAGLMVEMQDVSRIRHITDLKEDLIERAGFRLRSDAEAIVLATSLIVDDSVSADVRGELGTMLSERAQSTARVVEELREHLSGPDSGRPEEGYPLDAIALLRRVVEAARSSAAARRVEFLVETPNYPRLVHAESHSLAALLRAIIDLLLEDAADDSQLHITVSEQDDRQILHCSNEGFGIPDDRLQHYLADDTPGTGPEYQALRNGRRLLPAWDGAFEAHSAVGRGFEFRLELSPSI